MLRPSYAELMDVLNKETNGDEAITSRYTIVIATAKRARQLIDGDIPMVEEIKGKPVSTSVAEFYEGKIKVVPEGEGTDVYKKDIKDNIESIVYKSNNIKVDSSMSEKSFIDSFGE